MQLVMLRAAHTLIVALNAAGILYTIHAGLANRFGPLLWAAMALSAVIAAGLALNNFVCPLQNVARAIAGTDRWTPDLFMPNWAAYLIAPVLGPLMALGYGLVLWRFVQRWRGAAAPCRERLGGVGGAANSGEQQPKSDGP